MRNTPVKNLFSAAILTATLFGLSSAPAKAEGELLATVKERGTLLVGLEATYPPFNYQDENGELVGFEVDVAKAIAERLGVTAEFVPTKWDGMLAGLETERFDVITNQVTITEERQKKYDFSQPYTVSGIQVITLKDNQNDYTVPADLEGKKVGVGLGSNYEDWLTANVPGAEVSTYDENATKLQDLLVGRIDAFLNDRLAAAYLLEHSDGRIVAAGEPFDKQRMGVALRKNNEDLLLALNKAIDELRADGTLAAISQKWFKLDVTK
ncbi:cystine ABC transporter substrate-binding protein [Kiloniella laminariae]|uniref:Cystine ABC transporter substrate-binding protein n=1 Tax=Kiloniella laminariae TaxID=454162 RepID=A0ABT4LN40_9PROT|nr:cystine ABC transporter substrate-binding protein [Kiloniella laminariae]MCZ4282536.1 cystine ABC transporter substrate-binding protein [Kiloniella laminariae]